MVYDNFGHYGDDIMGAMASQITSLAIVYSTVYSDANQRKHQSSASLAFVRGIHRGPMNSPHKWPVTRKMFPFDDVIIAYASLMTRISFVSLRICITMRLVIINEFCKKLYLCIPFYLYKHIFDLITAWTSNYAYHNVWDEIINPFSKFNSATVDVWEWISNFTPHFTGHMITYPRWNSSWSMLVKRALYIKPYIRLCLIESEPCVRNDLNALK